MISPTRYRGRFAPSPTGPLHFGSLVAAVASFLQARSQHGEWCLRIEDIDPAREQAGAADSIRRTLEAFGLAWDGPVLYQRRRAAAYEAALETLRQRGALYPCGCSRREIADSGVAGVDGPVYPGTCRNGMPAGRERRAWRVRTDASPLVFHDRWRGRIERSVGRDYGDFVLRRADGRYAYQLAVVVDDAVQGITEVVRGADLLESTPRQIYLQRLLGLPTPGYAHHALVVNAQGQKLSKQTRAPAVDPHSDRLAVLREALRFLGQPLDWITACDWRDFWRTAAAHWQPHRLRGR